MPKKQWKNGQKKNQKNNITRINGRKDIEVDSPKVASEMPWRCPLLSFLRILLPNRQVPKGVGTEMKALVASWGLLLHDEGAWGAVESCRGLLAGLKGAHITSFRISGSHLNAPRPPNVSQSAPQEGQK